MIRRDGGSGVRARKPSINRPGGRHRSQLDPTTYRLTHLYGGTGAAMKTGLNELMQIYTIKIVAGALGQVPAIVGFRFNALAPRKFYL